jgi:hypothetical protein
MTIQFSPDGSIVLKSKAETITLGAGVAINSYSLPGRGEYDVASVQAEVYQAGNALAYCLRTEDLFTVFLDAPDLAVTELDDVANCNILLLDLRSDTSKDVVKTIIKRLEPSYVFAIGISPELIESLALPQQPAPLKITRAGLPLEGTTLVTAP